MIPKSSLTQVRPWNVVCVMSQGVTGIVVGVSAMLRGGTADWNGLLCLLKESLVLQPENFLEIDLMTRRQEQSATEMMEIPHETTYRKIMKARASIQTN